MKKSGYKTGTLLLISLFLISFSLSGQEELTKEFHKEYAVKQGTKLDLNNRYGDIIIQSSETDQVVIDVKVTVKYPNRDKAERLLSYINVQFTESENVISALTEIDDKFSFTGWSGDSRRFSIDYNVKMPVWMDLTLANRYGDTDIDDLSGLLDFDIKYGNLTASKLTRGDVKPWSSVNIAYGNSTIDEAGWLDVTTRYCGNFSLNRCQALLLDSKYSKLKIGTASSIVGEVRYNNVLVENLNNMVLDAGYTDVNLGTLKKKLTFNGGYGGLTVESVPVGFESLEIMTRYTGVRIGIAESASYNLDAKVSYCGIKYNDEKFQTRKRIVENTSSEINGIVGGETSPTANVKVNASYGSVKLY
jgi:hypothetical protein